MIRLWLFGWQITNNAQCPRVSQGIAVSRCTMRLAASMRARVWTQVERFLYVPAEMCIGGLIPRLLRLQGSPNPS
jgi:hypothetical protein